MVKNEIKEFVSKTIDQIKSGLPKGCVIKGDFNFDISLITEKKKDGKIDIYIAGLGLGSNTQTIHKVKFSITDEKSMEKNIQQAGKLIKELLSDFSKLEQLNE